MLTEGAAAPTTTAGHDTRDLRCEASPIREDERGCPWMGCGGAGARRGTASARRCRQSRSSAGVLGGGNNGFVAGGPLRVLAGTAVVVAAGIALAALFGDWGGESVVVPAI